MVHLIDCSFNVCTFDRRSFSHSILSFSVRVLTSFAHQHIRTLVFMRGWFELSVCVCPNTMPVFIKKTNGSHPAVLRSGIDIKIAFQQRFENWLISIRWMRTFMWISIVLQCFCHIQFNVFISLLVLFLCLQMALMHKKIQLFLFQRNWRCRFNSVKWWNIQLSILLELMPFLSDH